jgi:hypothetical protein
MHINLTEKNNTNPLFLSILNYIFYCILQSTHYNKSFIFVSLYFKIQ